MKLKLLALRDIKANYYKPPMAVPNTNAAIRDLADMVNDAQGKEDWQRHPEDFELWELGEWDNETAYFDTEHDGSHTEPKQLLVLSTLKRD